LNNKRFIEQSFPVKEVSIESTREKNIRHGHISTLHIWWARRPLASSRATAYAALTTAPKDTEEWDKRRQFIIDLSKWENSLNSVLIEKARKDILGIRNQGSGISENEPIPNAQSPMPIRVLDELFPNSQSQMPNPLLEDVKEWGNWVLEAAKKEIGRFYPKEKDGSIPVGYIWARTIPCQNPSCNAEIPLMRQFWLAKKENKKVALKPFVVGGIRDQESGIRGNKVEFAIVEQKNGQWMVTDSQTPMPNAQSLLANFDPSKGTVKGAVARCLVCGSPVDANTTRKLFREGKAGQRMVAVVLRHPKKKGKTYRVATEKDLEVFKEAEKYLDEKRVKLMEEWGIDPVPDEPTPEGKGKGAERAFSVRNYGMNTWGDLFNSRQKLDLITFVEKVREAYKKMIEEGYDDEYVKAVVSYLALGMDMTAAFTNALARWENTSEAIKQLYSRQALPMLWDYAEVNPFSTSSGSFKAGREYYFKVMKHCSQSNSTPAIVFQSSATSLSYPDNYFDAVFTDPPYYDNMPYSYLSDFFYVWLKRTVGDLYPELFSTPLTPKSKEIVAYTNDRTWEEAKALFEENLKKTFQEIYRVLKPDGIATIVYTHKSTSGWETLINSLLDSNLVITASWPIDTEMKARLRAKQTSQQSALQ